ncbi:MAG: DNRLRE domain-containing protein, partial [Candidatus Thermoplasmatota archaeon]
MRNYEDSIKCLVIVVMLCCVPAFVVTSAQSTGSEMEKKAQGLHSSIGSVARYKTTVLTPIADTWVLEGYNYNYGSSSTLCSLQYVAPDWDGRYKTYGGVSWLKFDVGNIKLANIISAKLKLFCVVGWLPSFFNNHTATWFSNDNWDEHTLVWSTALTLSSALNVQEITLTSIRKPWTAAGEMTFDVTYFIKYEKNSITTFKILASRGTSSVFASKEYPAVYQGLRPKLEITYKTIPYIGLSFGWLEHWRTDLKSTSYERIYLDE